MESQYSWEVITNKSIAKTLDKSFFKRSTGVVPGVYSFFNVSSNSSHTDIVLRYSDSDYEARINNIQSNDESSRLRLSWSKDFGDVINEFFGNDPVEDYSQGILKMVFIKTPVSNVFNVGLINLEKKFVKNKDYRRSEIHDIFGGNRQRGISSSKSHDHPILIFSNPDKGQDVYEDKWSDDIFYYSGEGRKGDMSWSEGNLAIKNHCQDNRKIYLFESDNYGFAKFVDEVRMIGVENYQNLDDEGNKRNAFQFLFQSTLSINNDFQDSIEIPTITERKGLVTSRVGQDKYRDSILKRWNNECAVLKINLPQILIASHIKPWKDSNNLERKDVANGILLSPTLDAFFDRHLISFDNSGKILLSRKIDEKTYSKVGINKSLCLKQVFDDMKIYLEHHRERFYKIQKLT